MNSSSRKFKKASRASSTSSCWLYQKSSQYSLQEDSQPKKCREPQWIQSFKVGIRIRTKPCLQKPHTQVYQPSLSSVKARPETFSFLREGSMSQAFVKSLRVEKASCKKTKAIQFLGTSVLHSKVLHSEQYLEEKPSHDLMVDSEKSHLYHMLYTNLRYDPVNVLS